MGLLKNDTFICVDCETTGLEPEKDRIIEIAAVLFRGEEILESYETLIYPEITILPESSAIHHITDAMVEGKPKIEEVLPHILKMIGRHMLVGHGIPFDIAFLHSSAKRHSIPSNLPSHSYLDTLRLARLYGQCPVNSLEKLKEHFNILSAGAHRAMNDVLVNIEVFRFLTQEYKTTEQLLERLKKPILLKTMPLGKHKGRLFSEIPTEYLLWASNKDFDQDFLFSVRTELKKRKSGNQFYQSTNPFASL
ncbi:MAG: DNA polymerase III subunit epsilon [Chlamydiae bacterium]|nr:DNA polymerase III subunit epsilon [Chlamydiota bacterium]